MITIIRNIIISQIANRDFGEMQQYNKEKFDKKDCKFLLRDVGALALDNISNVALNATDNIIISAFLGTSLVALIANYKMLKTSVESFLTPFYEAVTPSLGNLAASEVAAEKNQIRILEEAQGELSTKTKNIQSMCLVAKTITELTKAVCELPPTPKQ
jgi:O-antigen/teichoic acid export membrane protein